MSFLSGGIEEQVLISKSLSARALGSPGILRRLLKVLIVGLSGALGIGLGLICCERGVERAETAALNQRPIQEQQRPERGLSGAEQQAFAAAYQQGKAFVAQGRFDEAVRSFLTCLQLDPGAYQARMDLGQCYLRTGRFAEAVETFRRAQEADLDRAGAPYFLGVALLRLNRAAEAIQPLEQAIDRDQEDLQARWNLRIAWGQTDRDPDSLDESYGLVLAPRLPPAHESLKFADVGQRAGVARVNMGRGSAWRDLDHDGWLDLFTVAENSPHALYRNNGDGTFADITQRAGVADPRGGWSALWIDYDNDGAADLFVTRNAWSGQGANALYRNKGDGTFEDITRQVGLGKEADSFCAAWGDYDNDGWLDLYVANGVSQQEKGWPNALYHNKGDGTFTNVAMKAGVADNLRRSIGVTWGDYDNDGWLDLYVVNFLAHNALYRNNGDGTFTEVTEAAGVADPFIGFVAFFFDYDNDGWLDLFVSSWTSRMEEVIQSMVTGKPSSPGYRPSLYHNNGDGTFTDATARAGLAWTLGTMAATCGDVDNDGYQDLYLANGGPPMDRFEPDLLFLNNGDGTFADVTFAAGLGNTGKGHGPTMADYDNDGDLDIYAPQGGMGGNPGDSQPNSLYRNRGNQNHWLIVEVVGSAGEGKGKPFSNRDGVGAKVTVKVGENIRYAEVSGGGGFGVTNSLPLEFGLGAATRVDLVEVRWPSGLVDRVKEVPADRMLTIGEAGRETTYGEDQ